MQEELTGLKPLYFLPGDDFVREVLIPGFRVSTTVDIMVGYFSSASLGAIAPGLATFLRSTSGTVRLVVSPYLSDEDRAALTSGISNPEHIASAAIDDFLLSENALQLHTRRCLAHLVSTGRLQFRVALLKNALFHPKVWLFNGTDGARTAAHGSSNMTAAGLAANYEQISVSRSWMGPSEHYSTWRLQDEFIQLWDGRKDDCVVVELPKAIEMRLLVSAVEQPPREEELAVLFARARQARPRANPLAPPGSAPSLVVPPEIDYASGPYKYQAEAVESWLESGSRGILEMATGAGKTLTALIAASRLQQSCEPLVVVVAAPYRPLVDQWKQEVNRFGLEPYGLGAGPEGRARSLQQLARRLRVGVSKTEVIVVSHDTLCSHDFRWQLSQLPGAQLLIADEVHNLGRPQFVDKPPVNFQFRLGLSATPLRQYDPDGTAHLLHYFGKVVFQFGLDKAIGTCLVPYDYHVHKAILSPSELEDWMELSERIRVMAPRAADDYEEQDDLLKALLIRRRAILETAGSKLTALERCLREYGPASIRHTLVYVSDKDPTQLDQVNQLLTSLGIQYRQITAEDTGNRAFISSVLDAFREGEIQILAAKRVLDEGVNIPEISVAYILASTTVERQWIQRRGRVLRRCPSIGKHKAVVHDFVALPPDQGGMDAAIKTLIGSELKRVRAFAALAANAGRPDGPIRQIDQMTAVLAATVEDGGNSV